MQQEVIVIGHKNPDCDSICAAIAYAYFKNIMDKHYRYIPARAGSLNSETQFVLERFGIECPIEIESLAPVASDMELKKPIVAFPHDSLRYVASLMKQKNIRTVPVVDASRKLLGIVGLKDIAEHYIETMGLSYLSRTSINLNTLVDALDGKVIINPAGIEQLTGRIFIAAMQKVTILNKVRPGDVVILGDRTDVQIDLINSGCSALIITGNSTVSQEVIELASKKGTLIISSPHDTFTTAKLLDLSIPLHAIMERDVPVAGLYTPIAELKRKIMNSKYRCVLLVDGARRLISIVTRTDLLQPIRKKVILVDHNELTQAVEGVQEAEILEIIDHHRVGDISTMMPIKVHNEPVGSTCTIIADFMFLHQIDIPRDIAGLLLSGILSDTLILALSTTTEHDREIAEQLAAMLELSIEGYGKELLSASTDIKGMSARDILLHDFKEYQLGDKRVGVGQIMVLDEHEIETKKDALKQEMERLRKAKRYDLLAFLITNPLKKGEKVLVKGDKQIIERAFEVEVEDDECLLPGTMSRKKDFIPAIGYFCSTSE